MKKRYSYLVVYAHQGGSGRTELRLNSKIKTYEDIVSCDNIIKEYHSREDSGIKNAMIVDYRYLGRIK